MIWAIDLLNSPLEKHPLTLQISDDLHFKSTAMQKKNFAYMIDVAVFLQTEH